MKLECVALCTLLLTITSCTATKVESTSVKTAVPARQFDFTYNVTLPKLPQHTRLLRTWIPVATSNLHQTVKLLNTTGTVPLRITHESEYGNRMAYAKIRHPRFATAHFTLTYHVKREEYSMGSYRQLMQGNGHPVHISPSLARFVQPDRLIPIDGEIKQVADNATAGKQGEIAKAHAIYDYVFHHMRYEKSGTG